MSHRKKSTSVQIDKNENIQTGNTETANKEENKGVIPSLSTLVTTIISIILEKVIDKSSFIGGILKCILFALSIIAPVMFLICIIIILIKKKTTIWINFCMSSSLLLMANAFISYHEVSDVLYDLLIFMSMGCTVIAIVLIAFMFFRMKALKDTKYILAVLSAVVVFCFIMLSFYLCYNKVPNVIDLTVKEAKTQLGHDMYNNIKLQGDIAIDEDNEDWIVTRQKPQEKVIRCIFDTIVLTAKEPSPPEEATEGQSNSGNGSANNSDAEKNVESIPAVEKIKTISSIFKAIPVKFENSNILADGRFGPGKEYAEDAAYDTNPPSDTKKQNTIYAYYSHNGWVLIDLYYGELAIKKWIFIDMNFISNEYHGDIPPIEDKDVTIVDGVIVKGTSPYRIPEKDGKTYNIYKLEENTPVKAYFTDENRQFAFVEYSAHKDEKSKKEENVYMWVPLDCIDFGYYQ